VPLVSPPRRGIAAAAALLVLAALTVLTIVSVQPPAPAGTGAPADAFSAARAFVHDQRIAAQTHVVGSPAQDEVREYLVSTLTGFGLQPTVQDGVGQFSDDDGLVAMARVRNVVAVLPGTAPTGRVYLVAHYDSVQVGPGGSDDGAGSSALLETARALTSGGTKPRNDIVFVFTDGEEACLCGAEAFAASNPLASSGGVVLNLEARGTGGPVIMFETSAGNARLVGVYGATVPHPVATSFAVEVYRILPNDTDFSIFRDRRGFAGLNAAYIDGVAAYHTPQDTPSNMDKGSLQAHGDNVLALARAFGAEDIPNLTLGGTDATYFPALGLLVRYPGALVWPLAILALLAVVGLGVLAVRRGLASIGRIAAAFGLATVPLVLVPVVAQLFWTLLVVLRPGYVNLIDPWRPGWYRLAVVALVATVLLAWYGLLRRWLGPAALATGALGWLAVLGLVLASATPGGAYLAALPALFGAVAGVAALFVRPVVAQVAILVAGGAVAVLVLAPTVYLFFPALGLELGAAAALFGLMLAFTLLPVAEWLYPAGRRLWRAAPAVACGLVAVACTVAGLAVDRFTVAHPAPTQLMYALDADTGQARWVSAEPDPVAWTRQYVTGTEDLHGAFPVVGTGTVATGPAPAAQLPAPDLAVLFDSTTNDRRTLTLRLRPQRTVRLAYLRLDGGGTIVSANVAGRTVAVRGDRLEVLFHAPPADGIVLTVVLDRPEPVSVRVMDGSDGLDGLPGFVPRPAGVGIKGSHLSELVVVAKTVKLG